jgi:hypothetical protein
MWCRSPYLQSAAPFAPWIRAIARDAAMSAGPGRDVPLYLDLHSNLDAAGVIRGQIVGAPEPGTLLLLGPGLAILARRRIRV